MIACGDGHRDHRRVPGLSPLVTDLRGNFIVIKAAEGEFCTLAHLMRNTLRVLPGESVSAGQPIARCGNSGNSSMPHLHIQVTDRPSMFFSAGLPIRFRPSAGSPWLEVRRGMTVRGWPEANSACARPA